MYCSIPTGQDSAARPHSHLLCSTVECFGAMCITCTAVLLCSAGVLCIMCTAAMLLSAAGVLCTAVLLCCAGVLCAGLCSAVLPCSAGVPYCTTTWTRQAGRVGMCCCTVMSCRRHVSYLCCWCLRVQQECCVLQRCIGLGLSSCCTTTPSTGG